MKREHEGGGEHSSSNGGLDDGKSVPLVLGERERYIQRQNDLEEEQRGGEFDSRPYQPPGSLKFRPRGLVPAFKADAKGSVDRKPLLQRYLLRQQPETGDVMDGERPRSDHVENDEPRWSEIDG